MKIIDLYVKIANKEFIPRYIKVKDRRYEFDGSDNEYYPRNENDNDTLLERISRGNVFAWLNIEVETLNSLEEEKKIPEKICTNRIINTKDILEFEMIQNKINAEYTYAINEIIDYLKSKGDE